MSAKVTTSLLGKRVKITMGKNDKWIEKYCGCDSYGESFAKNQSSIYWKRIGETAEIVTVESKGMLTLRFEDDSMESEISVAHVRVLKDEETKSS